MAIYLIRHGETEGNRDGVVQKADIGLSEHGIEQARRLAARLAGAGISDILASDLPRAAAAAAGLQQATRAALVVDPGLHERNLGDLRGTPYSELRVHPLSPDYQPPGGESWEVFHERVADVWLRVQQAAERAAGHLAVVTHGLVCRRVVQHHALHDPRAQELEHWSNTSLTILQGPEPWRVRLLNCTEHLQEQRTGAPV